MKSFPKILTIAFLIIFIFQLIGLIFIFTLPSASQAAPAEFTPQVQIPGMEQEFGAPNKTGGYAIPGSTAGIASYIKLIYKYAIGIVGILAAVVLMIGGVMWIIAGGNATAIGEAKAWIGASLTGLVLALSSYLILATVNPALVDFRTSNITTVDKVISSDTNYCCDKIKGIIEPTVTTVDERQQFNCPDNSTLFTSDLANCVKDDIKNEYQLVKLKINCCLVKKEAWDKSNIAYICLSRENLADNDCYHFAYGVGDRIFMEDYHCKTNICVPN